MKASGKRDPVQLGVFRITDTHFDDLSDHVTNVPDGEMSVVR